VTVAALVLLSQLLLLPPVLAGYQVIWALWVQGPLVAGAFIATPLEDDDVMKQMPRACKRPPARHTLRTHKEAHTPATTYAYIRTHPLGHHILSMDS
jgi:hypothetical protein